MSVFPNLRARYSKGTLKLLSPLDLPEGVEVRVTVMPVEEKRHKSRKGSDPTQGMSWESLKALTGVVSLGGDALADSEALCRVEVGYALEGYFTDFEASSVLLNYNKDYQK